MTLDIGPEPEGLLVQRADVLAWVPGLSADQWKKMRPHLERVKVLGCARPFYRKAEVRRKLVDPILRNSNKHDQ
jgi:hypothetical protein